jgi:hypothetical protein
MVVFSSRPACRRKSSWRRWWPRETSTQIVAFCDMQGRLTGKRVSAQLKARAYDPHRVTPSLPDPASRRAT